MTTIPPIAQLALTLLVEYQTWSGEKVYTESRATQIVEDLFRLMRECKSKTAAVDWLMKEDWIDKRKPEHISFAGMVMLHRNTYMDLLEQK